MTAWSRMWPPTRRKDRENNAWKCILIVYGVRGLVPTDWIVLMAYLCAQGSWHLLCLKPGTTLTSKCRFCELSLRLRTLKVITLIWVESKHSERKDVWKWCQMWGIFRHTRRVCYLTYLYVSEEREFRTLRRSCSFWLVCQPSCLMLGRFPQLFVMERCTHSAFGCVWERAINVGVFM